VPVQPATASAAGDEDGDPAALPVGVGDGVGATVGAAVGALDGDADGAETGGALLALGVVVETCSPPIQPAASTATAAARSRRVGR